MNKKRLSVVMAGAMLASSVAPVLAAEVTAETMGADQRGLLISGIRNLMKSKMLDGTAATDDSAYGFTVVAKGENDRNSDGTLKSGVTLYNKLGQIDTILRNGLTDTSEKTIRVYEKETRIDEFGKLTDIGKKGDTIKGEPKTYKDLNELENLAVDIQNPTSNNFGANNLFVKDCQWVNHAKHEDGLKIILNAVEDPNAEVLVNKTFVIKVGDKKIAFKDAYDKNGLKLHNVEEDVQKFDHFGFELNQDTDLEGQPLKGLTLKQEINLVKAEDAKDSYTVEELFDGLMLTAKGVELFETIKYDKENDGLDYGAVTVDTLLPGIYGFHIDVIDTDAQKVVKTITVRGLNKNNFDILKSWMDNEEFTVGELAGQNRYETAVKIAKEQALGIKDLGNENYVGNIVLVNGNSLVDGLSAAPLASALRIHNTGTPATAAPILLSEADELPKATKEYLKELLAYKPVGKLETTVHLVGGEAVLSESLEKELKDLGFTVKRYGGDNREETSLEVAEAINKKSPLTNLYVVGANGEADAMSIAPVASAKATAGAVIVAKNGGLSKVAYKEIDDYAGANITIVGGEKSISADEESKLKEIAKENSKKVERVAGKNRKATNAAIIEKYYNLETKAVIVAKDGQANKMHLIDALTAANFASNKNAPIVLATDNLSNEQINELNKKASKVSYLYNVGYGVNKNNVTAKLAELFNLPITIEYAKIRNK